MPAAVRKEVGTAMSSHAPQGTRCSPGAAGPFAAGHADRVVTVLAISPFDEDHIFLHHLFSHSNWRIHQARSYGEALAVLHDHPIPVVLCDSEMPDGSWKDALSEMADLPEAPLLIVTSRLADDNLWAEVLNLGGYDVLMKPFDRLEVLRVISLAWLHWKQRRERAASHQADTRVAVG
jgi:DNA-binding response OmpR family regulator